jgi:guanine deaminase
MSVSTPIQAFRASILYFSADPTVDELATHYLDDGLLLIQASFVVDVIAAQELSVDQLAQYTVIDYRGKLLMPGFIDTHIHFPQTEMIASYGEQLLEWLNRYTFPTECKFADADYAAERAEFFID